MTKENAIFLGLLTFYPFAYLLYAILYGPRENPSVLFLFVHISTCVFTLALWFAYMYMLHRSNVAPEANKSLWTLFMVFGNYLAMISFWYYCIFLPIIEKEELTRLGHHDKTH